VQLYYLIIVSVWSLFCVFALAGQVYERRLIEKYIQENGRDPISKVNIILFNERYYLSYTGTLSLHVYCSIVHYGFFIA